MTHHSSPRPSSQCHLRTAFYYVARRQTSVGMFVAKPPLNLEGHATAIQLWKACLVETRHSAASAPCTSSLYPSTPPPGTTCSARTPFPFLWSSPVKSLPSLCCFNCLQSAAVDGCIPEELEGKLAKEATPYPKVYAGQWQATGGVSRNDLWLQHSS